MSGTQFIVKLAGKSGFDPEDSVWGGLWRIFKQRRGISYSHFRNKSEELNRAGGRRSVRKSVIGHPSEGC